MVWLGTAPAGIQSWSDTTIVATVGAGSLSGQASVLQNGTMAGGGPFTVDVLQISGLSANSARAGDEVTIAGNGFGSSPGTVQLGDGAGMVVTWSDTSVVAKVAAGARSGVARIQQGGAWSNAKPFAVLGTDGSSPALTLTPTVLTMQVGDTRTLQALSASGQTVTGLAWTASDPTIVTLSADDPPLLTALAAGHVTIAAGPATADITVMDTLPMGTVIWSNAGNGSGVERIVPAVPSASGVADVFAFQKDGTVAAITSDGTTAWTANIGQGAVAVPDFQGGLVVRALDETTGASSIWKVDGMTGQAYAKYVAPGNASVAIAAVHPDGTVFALDSAQYAVVGIDPTTGAAKFTVPMVDRSHAPLQGDWVFGGESHPIGSLIAGDGYFYASYVYREPHGEYGEAQNVDLLQVGSDGTSQYDHVVSFDTNTWEWDYMHAGMITNADNGILLTWEATSDGIHYTNGLAQVSAGNVSLVPGPQIPGQNNDAIAPVLQAQDGSFVGTASVGDGQYMISFDASGNTRWTVPNMCPQIATADGGVIAQAANQGSCENLSGAGYTFNANGNATGQMGLLTQSWTGNTYQLTDSVQGVAEPWLPEVPTSFWSRAGGNASGSGTAYVRCPCLLQSSDTTIQNQVASALLQGHAALLPRDHQGHTYLMLVSQPGIRFNAGQSFVLAGQTASAALSQSEALSIGPSLVSNVTDFARALTTSGLITGPVTATTPLGMSGPIVGGVTYFGHGGWITGTMIDGTPFFESALALSPLRGVQYNLSVFNVDQLSNTKLDRSAAIVLNACDAGSNRFGNPIAQLIANELSFGGRCGHIPSECGIMATPHRG